jgi:hypothetical protein
VSEISTALKIFYSSSSSKYWQTAPPERRGMPMRTMLLSTALALSLSGLSQNGKAAETLPEVATQLLADGFNAPLFLVAPDDGSGRRFVGEQRGDVYIIDAAGKRIETPFLDLRPSMVTLLKAFDLRGQNWVS